MSDAVIQLHVPDTLLRDAGRQAERSGVSVEDWLLSLAAENIRYERVADRFFRHAPDPDAARTMREVLNSTQDNPPGSDDEL